MWKDTLKKGRKTEKDEKEKGASVVEVTIITPMIFLMIMGAIFLLFFFYDMAVIRSETIKSADYAAEEWRKEGHGQALQEEGKMRERIRGSLLIGKVKNTSIRESFGVVIAEAGIGFSLAGRQLVFSNYTKAAVNDRETWCRVLYKEKR